MTKVDSEKKTRKSKSTAKAEPEITTAAAKAAALVPKVRKPIIARRPLLGGTPLAKVGDADGWRLVDAKGATLGRLSSCIATILMGKDKPLYTRFIDTGDHVVVINAEKVLLTGKKWADKTYHYHTNYPGGIKSYTAQEIRDGRFPERILKWAVYGMLPKGHMGRKWYKKLHVYTGDQHPHSAQQPVQVEASKLGAMQRD